VIKLAGLVLKAVRNALRFFVIILFLPFWLLNSKVDPNKAKSPQLGQIQTIEITSIIFSPILFLKNIMRCLFQFAKSLYPIEILVILEVIYTLKVVSLFKPM
jgi:hypothetical protein